MEQSPIQQQECFHFVRLKMPVGQLRPRRQVCIAHQTGPVHIVAPGGIQLPQPIVEIAQHVWDRRGLQAPDCLLVSAFGDRREMLARRAATLLGFPQAGLMLDHLPQLVEGGEKKLA